MITVMKKTFTAELIRLINNQNIPLDQKILKKALDKVYHIRRKDGVYDIQVIWNLENLPEAFNYYSGSKTVKTPIKEEKISYTPKVVFREKENKDNKYDIVTVLKAEQRSYKSEFSSKFLSELNLLLEQCFLPAKNKKEHFVTKEKLSLSFLKLLQSQKKFKTTECISNTLASTAVIDLDTQLCGRVLSIDLLNQKVEFITLYNLRENLSSYTKSFSEVAFFDPRTMQMEYYYNLQKTKYDCFCYLDTFAFLTGKIEDIKKYSQKNKATQQTIHFSTPTLSSSKVKIDRRHMETDIHDV